MHKKEMITRKPENISKVRKTFLRRHKNIKQKNGK